MRFWGQELCVFHLAFLFLLKDKGNTKDVLMRYFCPSPLPFYCSSPVRYKWGLFWLTSKWLSLPPFCEGERVKLMWKWSLGKFLNLPALWHRRPTTLWPWTLWRLHFLKKQGKAWLQQSKWVSTICSSSQLVSPQSGLQGWRKRPPDVLPGSARGLWFSWIPDSHMVNIPYFLCYFHYLEQEGERVKLGTLSLSPMPTLSFMFVKTGLSRHGIAHIFEVGKSKFKEDKQLAQSHSAGKWGWTTVIVQVHVLS